MNNEPGLRNGVYSYAEAAGLLVVTPQRIRRWADGYTFQRAYDKGVSRPVLQTARHAGVLTFDELWELMFVKTYVGLEVPLPQIRETAEALAKEVGPFPFSTSELVVAGRKLLVKAAEGVLKRADIGQLVADYSEELKDHVEIRGEHVGRYNIPEFGKQIYLDKERRGGEAVVTERAIPTRLIFGLWEKEKDLLSVADYFELSGAEISMAIRYEGQWRNVA